MEKVEELRGATYVMKNIAVLGPKGTFTDCASIVYKQRQQIDINQVYYKSIDETVYAASKECDLAIIPVENTLDGYVQRSLDLLLEMNLHIIYELYIPVQFSLVANSNNLNDIKRLYVQFKTKGQCTKAINKLKDEKIIITESNIESLNMVKNGTEGDAAIIPSHMFIKDEYSFGIDNVTDSENNHTRFLVVETAKSNNKFELNKSIKISLYILEANDKPGMLFNILKQFAEKNINIVSIISRPTKKSMGKYNFFIELAAKIEEKALIIETIDKINEEFNVKILGIYSKI